METGVSASLAGGYPIANNEFVTGVLGLLGTVDPVPASINPFAALLLQADGRVYGGGASRYIAGLRIHRAASADHAMAPRAHHAV